MAAINSRRVWLGALVGGIVWFVWSTVMQMCFLMPRYAAAQAAGLLLAQPRYPFFGGLWFVILLALAYVVASLYASVRATCGAGPMTALYVGLLVGFAAGFPQNFAMSTWSPLSRYLPLGWMLEMWVGAILAALVAGWLYKD